MQTVIVFTVSAVAAAGVVGFLAGAALGWLPDPTLPVVAMVLLVSLGVDLVHRRTGHLQPIRVDGQVPREWGALFGPRTVAMLYGARLGVGPLTLLPTWLWWSVTGIASLFDAGVGALVAVAFGAARAAGIVVASLLGERHRSGEGWVTTLARRDPHRMVAVACGVGVALALAACSTQQATPIPGNATNPAGAINPAGPRIPADTNPSSDTNVSMPPTSMPPSPSATPDPTTDASATPGTGSTPRPTPTRPTTTVAPSSADELAAALLGAFSGFEPVAAPEADTFLDLGQASVRQPDPPAERALLETRGYRGGWTRAFRNDTQDVVMATVYEFRTAAEASFYLEDGLITVGGYGGELFDVEELPGARGFRQETADAIGPLVTHGMTFVEGNRWYLVFVLGDPQTATIDLAVDATRQQMILASAD